MQGAVSGALELPTTRRRRVNRLDRAVGLGVSLMPEVSHEVIRERVSLSQAMTRITQLLQGDDQLGFFGLFEGQRARATIIITFLARLELCKLKLVKVFQKGGEGDILISLRDAAVSLGQPLEVDESEYR